MYLHPMLGDHCTRLDWLGTLPPTYPTELAELAWGNAETTSPTAPSTVQGLFAGAGLMTLAMEKKRTRHARPHVLSTSTAYYSPIARAQRAQSGMARMDACLYVWIHTYIMYLGRYVVHQCIHIGPSWASLRAWLAGWLQVHPLIALSLGTFPDCPLLSTLCTYYYLCGMH